MTRYEWVAARKAEGFPTRSACQAAEVSRQAFYGWCARRQAGPTPAQRAEFELVAEIEQIHAESRAAYGSPRVCAVLHRRRLIWFVATSLLARLTRCGLVTSPSYPPLRVGCTSPQCSMSDRAS